MLPVIAVVAAAVLFGTTGTAQALGPDTSTPLAVGAVRLAIGGTALALLGLGLGARVRRRAGAAAGHPASPPRLSVRAFSLMAVTGVCLAAYQPLFFVGTDRNGVAAGTVVALGSAPVIAGLIEGLLTRRVPSRAWVAATALALCGVALLAFGGAPGGAGADPLGFAGSLGAGASFAVLALAQRRLMDGGWDPFTVAGSMGAISAALALAALPFVDTAWVAEPSGLAMSLWLGLGTIALAYTLFTAGLGRLTAATAATLTLAEPLTATLLGTVVLGERLTVAGIAGIVAIGAGLLLLAAGTRRPRPRPSALEG